MNDFQSVGGPSIGRPEYEFPFDPRFLEVARIEKDLLTGPILGNQYINLYPALFDDATINHVGKVLLMKIQGWSEVTPYMTTGEQGPRINGVECKSQWTYITDSSNYWFFFSEMHNIYDDGLTFKVDYLVPNILPAKKINIMMEIVYIKRRYLRGI